MYLYAFLQIKQLIKKKTINNEGILISWFMTVFVFDLKLA